MTRPRIRVLLTAYCVVPGTAPQSQALLTTADAVHAEVDMVTLKTERLGHLQRIGSARMFRVRTVPRKDRRPERQYARAVERQLSAEPYDIVHCLDAWSAAAVAAKKPSRTCLIYEVGYFPADPFGVEAERWCDAHEYALDHADRILVRTSAAKLNLQERGCRKPIDVVVLGVDLGRFDWIPKRTQERPHILHYGDLHPSTDPLTIVRAAKTILSSRPVTILLAGDANLARREMTQRVIESEGLQASVIVRGEIGILALPDLLCDADVCIGSSAGTPLQGLTELPPHVFQYAACQRPMVAAAVDGLDQCLGDEKEALLYSPGDETGLADGVLELLRDEDLRHRISHGAYTRVRTSASSGVRRRQMLEVYENVLPNSQASSPWSSSEEQSAATELPVSRIDALLEEQHGTRGSTNTDTAQTLVPGAPAADYVGAAPAPNTDTQPGLSVPDTSPGR